MVPEPIPLEPPVIALTYSTVVRANVSVDPGVIPKALPSKLIVPPDTFNLWPVVTVVPMPILPAEATLILSTLEVYMPRVLVVGLSKPTPASTMANLLVGTEVPIPMLVLLLNKLVLTTQLVPSYLRV